MNIAEAAYVEWMPPVYRLGDRLETRITLEDIPKKTLEREHERDGN